MREDLQVYPVFLHQQGLFKRRLKEFKLQINCPGCGKKQPIREPMRIGLFALQAAKTRILSRGRTKKINFQLQLKIRVICKTFPKTDHF